jgi:choline monooxygenase
MIPRLGPESYHLPNHHDQDVVCLKREGWHLVGLTSQLCAPGSYVACNVLGVPVVVRRFDDSLVAFRNVCAHRHCLLVDEGCGTASELKCRYHGWQYGPDGLTRRLPSSSNFPNFDRQLHRLETFSVETVGQLVFVRLAECGLSIGDWLGEFQSPLETASNSLNWKPNLMQRITIDANWKIPIEGSIESYHLNEVHAKTFGKDPGEQATRHEFSQRGTTFTTEMRGDGLVERWEESSVRWITGDFNRRYHHIHLFPNLLASITDAISLIYQVQPISPGQCEMFVVGLGRLPAKNNLFKRLWAWGMRNLSARIALKILTEDVKMFPLLQSGKCGARDCGILGRCEERLNAFHLYWKASLGTDENHLKRDART